MLEFHRKEGGKEGESKEGKGEGGREKRTSLTGLYIQLFIFMLSEKLHWVKEINQLATSPSITTHTYPWKRYN